MKTIAKSSCKMCHSECGVDVHIEDGEVTHIYGMRDGYGALLNRGKICSRGNSVTQFLYHPRRLKYPFEASWRKGRG